MRKTVKTVAKDDRTPEQRALDCRLTEAVANGLSLEKAVEQGLSPKWVGVLEEFRDVWGRTMR